MARRLLTIRRAPHWRRLPYLRAGGAGANDRTRSTGRLNRTAPARPGGCDAAIWDRGAGAGWNCLRRLAALIDARGVRRASAQVNAARQPARHFSAELIPSPLERRQRGVFLPSFAMRIRQRVTSWPEGRAIASPHDVAARAPGADPALRAVQRTPGGTTVRWC